MRMFVALIPPQYAVEDLDARVRLWPNEATALRCTLPEHWHVTLAFLPQVAPERLGELSTRLERAARRRRPLEMQLAGSVAFPRPTRARVVGVGVQAREGDQLRRLAVGCRAAVAKSGIETDQGRIRPHVTLARLRRPGDAAQWLSVIDRYSGPHWLAAEVALVESHLGAGPGGRPRYERAQTFPLGPS